MTQPLILVDPHPRTLAQICDADTLRRLQALGRLVVHEDGPMPAELVEQYLPEAVLVFGQTDLPADRLVRAPKLRAIVNVETNFLPNIDYDYCFAHGIHVITPSAAFAPAVAEAALGMAIDLARGITAADRAFRAGTEQYGLAANADSFMFGGAPVGLIGFIVAAVTGIIYLVTKDMKWDRVEVAAVEVSTMFFFITIVLGSIWARPAWNTWWTWDPRLTTTLLSLLIYVAYLVLRVFGGDGPGERKFAAALGVLGAANLPIIHFSVEKWAGQHPKVIMAKGGGGLHPDMKVVFFQEWETAEERVEGTTTILRDLANLAEGKKAA